MKLFQNEWISNKFQTNALRAKASTYEKCTYLYAHCILRMIQFIIEAVLNCFEYSKIYRIMSRAFTKNKILSKHDLKSIKGNA